MLSQNSIVGVEDKNIGPMGTGKTIFLPEEIKNLLTKFSETAGWNYSKKKSLFWLSGDEESITAASDKIAVACGIPPYVDMSKTYLTIKKQDFEIDGFICKRGVVTGNSKTKLIHAYNSDKDLQKLYDTLLTFKERHDHKQKSTSAHSGADNKSATPEIFKDIKLRVIGNDQYDKGNRIQPLLDRHFDIASLRTNIQKLPLIRFENDIDDKVILVPSILIEKAIAKLDTKIKDACKNERPVTVIIKHDLLSFYDDYNQFCTELAKKLEDITGLKEWHHATNEQGEELAVHKAKEAYRGTLIKALNKAGLTVTSEVLDEGIYAIAVPLAEVYIKLILNLNVSVNKTVHDNESKASNNPSPPSVVKSMITAGGHPAFTQSSPAVTSTLAATLSSTANTGNNKT